LYSTLQAFRAIEEDAILKQHFRRYQFACQYAAGRSLLEIGCELGVGAYYLAEKARFVLGIDNSRDWLKRAVELFRRDNLHFAAMDCAHLGLADDSFDTVCLLEVIEHVINPSVVLDEAKRTLARGGTFLLSTPNKLAAMADTSQLLTGDHVREFSYLELRELVGASYSEFEFYGQRSLEIVPLQCTPGFPDFPTFSRFLVVCRA
jgi:2-polyprenyl-3-methyl-5-hydroxy-6-metoxy-1,4-benzoquinol methylase